MWVATLRKPAFWLAFGSLSLVLALVYFDVGASSPGELSTVHDREGALAGVAGCVACHGDAEQSLADACLACHEPIAEQVAEARGFHGTLGGEVDALGCARCHLEHHGDEVALVGDRAFAVAGIQVRSDYGHEELGFALEGAHRGLRCEDCHALAEASVLPPGGVRYLGLQQGCTTCHDDPHRGELGVGCAGCHGQERPFEEVASFVHDVSFPLIGAHAGRACTECHAAGTDHALWTSFDPEPRQGPSIGVVLERPCSACHPSPHDTGFVEAVAAELGQAPERVCGECHDPESVATFGGADAELEERLHRLSGFALEEPHAGIACRECHVPEARDVRTAGERFERFRAAYPGRDADACEACHADPHGGQFERGAFAGRGCVACHDRRAFAPSAFAAAEHEATAFPLTGSHRAVGCFACHAAPSAEPTAGRAGLVFVGTPTNCSACHADAHAGAFDDLDEEHARHKNRCDSCHDTESFAGAREGFDHAAWTAFPLLGGHASVACEACHEPTRLPDANGRRLGRASAASASDCAACHADPHVGQFLEAGRTDCARCHTVEGFALAGVFFDHRKESRFALDKDHEDLDCTACHRPQPLKGGGSAVRYKPLGTECGDCHDPREGRGR